MRWMGKTHTESRGEDNGITRIREGTLGAEAMSTITKITSRDCWIIKVRIYFFEKKRFFKKITLNFIFLYILFNSPDYYYFGLAIEWTSKTKEKKKVKTKKEDEKTFL